MTRDGEGEKQRAVVGAREAEDVAVAVIVDAALVVESVGVARAEHVVMLKNQV